MIERLRRRLLEVTKDEFERSGRSDTNPTQALLRYNLGNFQIGCMGIAQPGLLYGLQYILQSKKLVDQGYINHQRSGIDRRSVPISLSDNGNQVAKSVDRLHERQIGSIEQIGGIKCEEFANLNKALQRLERFWTGQIH